MSLRFAILGLLVRESLTGYDLTKRFDSSIGFFWSAKHSQIYPELASLNAEGLVTFEIVTQTSKPNKKVYTITPAGLEALNVWVGEPSDRRNVKDPLLMRVWTLGTTDTGPTLAHLRETQIEWSRRRDVMTELAASLRAQGRDEPSLSNPTLGIYMAVDCGLRQTVAYLAWVEDAIALLTNLLDPKAEAEVPSPTT